MFLQSHLVLAAPVAHPRHLAHLTLSANLGIRLPTVTIGGLRGLVVPICRPVAGARTARPAGRFVESQNVGPWSQSGVEFSACPKKRHERAAEGQRGRIHRLGRPSGRAPRLAEAGVSEGELSVDDVSIRVLVLVKKMTPGECSRGDEIPSGAAVPAAELTLVARSGSTAIWEPPRPEFREP